MNLNKILGGLALSALIGAGLSSCSNDMDSYKVTTATKTIINKAPKIKAYSGDHFWGNYNNIAGLTRADGSLIKISDIETTFYNKESEDAYLDEYLPEGQDNIDKVDLDFLFYTSTETEVELFPVYAQTSQSHEIGIFYYDAEGNKHEETIWDLLSPYNLYSWDGILKGKKIIIPAGVFFGFYIDNNNWLYSNKEQPWESCEGGRLYSTASMNPASYPTKGNGNNEIDTEAEMIRTHAVTWVREYPDGSTKNYLGFEDWADFDYQDLVFTLTPEVMTVDASTFVPGETTVPPTTGEGPQPSENCDKCGHASHLPEVCPDCDSPEDGCYIAPDTDCPRCDHPSHGNGPCEECPADKGCNSKPVVSGDNHTNEVEVNLGIDTKGETSNGKYNESHLSIHVRSAVDVDVFIPMPLDLICPADDMEVVKKHLEGEMEHGGEFENAVMDEDGKVIMQGGLLSKMTYQIDGRWTVTLYVEYVAAGTESAHGETFDQEGIHIWSEGLEGNTDLMEYLQENYGDGITFEIWNYYADDSELGELKSYLDQSVIKFIGDNLPDYFINAFGAENYAEGKDCNVSLDEEQGQNFTFQGTGAHLNDSEYNDVYENNNHIGSGDGPAPVY